MVSRRTNFGERSEPAPDRGGKLQSAGGRHKVTFRHCRQALRVKSMCWFDGRCTSTILCSRSRCGAREAMTVDCKPTMCWSVKTGKFAPGKGEIGQLSHSFLLFKGSFVR